MSSIASSLLGKEEAKFSARYAKEQEEAKFASRYEQEQSNIQKENRSTSAFHSLSKGAVSGLTQTAPIAAGAYMGGAIGAPFLPPFGMAAGAIIGGIAGSPAGAEIKKYAAKIPGLTYNSVTDLPPDERPMARAGEVVGGSVPFAGMPYLAARNIPMSQAVPKGMFSTMINSARSTPSKFAVTEAGATAGAAQGAAISELFDPGDTTTAMAAETAGGVINPSGMVAKAVSKTMQGANTLVKSISVSGRHQRASELLQDALVNAGEDPKKVAALLRADDLPPGVSAGMKSESQTLLAFENKLASTSQEFDSSIKGGVIGANKILSDQILTMSRSSNPELVRVAAKLQQTRFERAIESKLNQAQTKISEATSKLVGDDEAASTRASGILEASMRDARKVEAQLWGMTPKNDKIKAISILDAHKNVLSERLPEDKLPPSFIDKFIKRASKYAITSGEVQIFRSRMLEMASEARGKSEWNNARVYADMADGALDDLSKIDRPEYTDARAWSKAFNDKFTRTFAGDAIAIDGSGARRIYPESVLKRGFGSGGAMANARFDEMNAAGKFSGRDMMTDQEEFIRHAASSVVDSQTGRVNQKALDKFVSSNETLLGKFPSVRKDLSDVSSAEAAFTKVEAATKIATKAVKDRAAFSRVLGYENPADAVGSALSSKFPEREYGAIVKMASKGGATGGLESATLDHVVRKATDSSGNFSFKLFNENLTRPMSQNGPSLLQIMGAQGVMKPGDVIRLNKLLTNAEQIERGLTSISRIDEMQGNPDGLWDIVVRAVGANVGGILGGGTGAPIVMAGAGSRYGRKLLEKVPSTRILDVMKAASKDPKFMATLLEKPRSVAHKRQLNEQVNAFLIQAGFANRDEENK